MKKAAVVIGVAKTGNLKELESVRPGAQEVASWLHSEGFNVECLVDDNKPVKAQEVKAALKKFVTKPASYHLLLIFFTGHGYWHARSDRWLLSAAHEESDEAINLEGAIDLARNCGVPTVIFVSDACRTLPQDFAGAVVEGIDAFPTINSPDSSKVDWFKAASPAVPAYEIPINGNTESVFTHALRAAYREPDPSMVREFSENGHKVEVVPNRNLEDFLKNKVSEVLTNYNINLTQRIEVNVPSGDDVYIARVELLQTAAAAPSIRPSPRDRRPDVILLETAIPFSTTTPDVGSEAADAIRGLLSQKGFMDPTAMVAPPPMSAPAQQELDKRQPVESVTHFETQCGITVSGAAIAEAAVSGQINNLETEIVEHGSNTGEPGIIRMHSLHPAATVFIILDDGKLVPLAVIDGYITHVVVSDEGVKAVSYVPSDNHYRFEWYEGRKERIDRLRSLVALAADRNSFHVQSSREAEELAGRIRTEKAIDPSLGLYASHAYAQAGADDLVRDVLRYMRDDISIDLFDVRLLANRKLEDCEKDNAVYPICPMLTQTWNLLRPRSFSVHPLLSESSQYLCNSLWTTFQPEATDQLLEALKSGELDESIDAT